MESNEKTGDAAFLTRTKIVSGNIKRELLPIIFPICVPIGLKFQDSTIYVAELNKEYENIDHN